MSGGKISFDMKTKKFRNYKDLYRLYTEKRLGGTDVGLPCRVNRLVILDVDVPSENHTHDGRQWIKDNWDRFPELAKTYRVNTPSGGSHFYFKLPAFVDEALFMPKGAIVRGVDIKWNGYVVAPPTAGYEPEGTLSDIQTLSAQLLEKIGYDENATSHPITDFKVNVPLTEQGGLDLLARLERVMPHHALTYSEWLEGIFSICAAIGESELREACIVAFTRNKSFKEGDCETALAKGRSANPHGGIGPGTIIKMLNQRDPEVKDKVEVLKEKVTYNTLTANPELKTTEKQDGRIVIIPTEGNFCTLLSTLYSNSYRNRDDQRYDSFYYDKRKRSIFINNKPYNQDKKELIYTMLYKIQHTYGMAQFRMAQASVGLEMFLQQRAVDPMEIMLRESKWDGEKRIHRFFTDYCKGDADEKYLQGVSQTFWRSLVYRIMAPGHKCDEMVILQGPEGQGKSTMAMEVAHGHFFACGKRDAFEDRDCIINMHKSVIVELEEMQSILKSDAEQAKGFITRTNDYVRQMHGLSSVDTPRGFILIGTCNKQHILTRGHGLRRYLPVSLVSKNPIDMLRIETDLHQLYAEAYEECKRGLRNYGLVESNTRSKLVSDHVVDHPWRAVVKGALDNRSTIAETELYGLMRISGVLGGAGLNLDSNRLLLEIMSEQGWKRRGHGWYKPPRPIEEML